MVTKRGKPLARITASGAQGDYPQKSLAGTVTVLGDIVGSIVDVRESSASDSPGRCRARS